jgi:hypothetical protein
MNESMTWEEATVVNEGVTAEDIIRANESKKVPPGEYLCRCESSRPVQVFKEDYSYIAANLTFTIINVYKMYGRKPTEEELAKYVGWKIFDNMILSHPQEKDSVRQRRILIADRLGLIDTKAETLRKTAFSEDIVGKEIVLHTKERSYVDKATGEEKTITQVAFDGYYAPDEDNVPF